MQGRDGPLGVWLRTAVVFHLADTAAFPVLPVSLMRQWHTMAVYHHPIVVAYRPISVLIHWKCYFKPMILC